jgi:hypothetical protein
MMDEVVTSRRLCASSSPVRARLREGLSILAAAPREKKKPERSRWKAGSDVFFVLVLTLLLSVVWRKPDPPAKNK